MFNEFSLDSARLYLLMLMAKVTKSGPDGFEIDSYYNVNEDVKWVIYKAQVSLSLRASTDFIESEFFDYNNKRITIDHPEIRMALECLSKRNYEAYVRSLHFSMYAFMAAIAIKKDMFYELSAILDHTSSFLRIPERETTLDSIRHYTAILRM